MVKKKTRNMRVDDDFIMLREQFKKDTGLAISSQDFTKNISRFLVEEDLYPIMARRAKKKKRRLF
jgi:hypothetical protein